MPADLVREAPLPFVVAPKPPARGPWLRLLNEVLRLAGPAATFLHHAERPWASATFSGTHHTILLAFEGCDAASAGETFVAAMPDHEFTVPRHLVADADIVAIEHFQAPPRMTVEVELLLLEDF